MTLNRTNINIKELLEKYRKHTASETEFEQLFDYLQNPENLEMLRQEFDGQWKEKEGFTAHSPLHWDDIQKEVRLRAARVRKRDVDRQHRRYLWMAAASILLIIGMAAGLLFSLQSDEMIFETGFGQVESIVLEDGSKITLNANSIIRWDKEWQKQGVRKVVLTGEAYFDVQSIQNPGNGEKVSFIVETKDMIIDVVGTSFNVGSRKERTAVYLVEGEVHLNMRKEEQERDVEIKKEKIVTQRGESVSYSTTTRELERAMGDRYGNASWTSGTFVFTETSVAKILQSLEDIYGKKFEVGQSELLERELTAGLPYSDWAIVKSALELLLKAELVEKDGKVIVEPKE